MRAFLVILLAFSLIGCASGYTLGGTTFKGDVDMYGNNLSNLTAPVLDSDAATKAYADSVAIGGGLPTTGGTMTGQIDFGGFTAYNSTTPVNDTDLSTKLYVDLNAVTLSELNNTSISGVINPKAYGAVCDGATNDSAAFLAAMQSASPGGTVIIPNGTMLITINCTPSDWNGITLAGMGQGSKIELGADITLFKVNDRVNFRDFEIIVPKTNTAPVLILGEDFRWSTFDNLYLTGTAVGGTWEGIRIIDFGHQVRFSNIKMKYPGIGWNMTVGTTDEHITDMIIDSLMIHTPTVGGILMSSTGGIVAGNTITNPHIIHGHDAAAEHDVYGIKMVGITQCNQVYGLNTWCDARGNFTAIDLGTSSVDNSFIGGHIEGAIVDSGEGNLLQNLDYRYSWGNASWDAQGGWMFQRFYGNQNYRNLLKNGDIESYLVNPAFWSWPGSNTATSKSSTATHSGNYALKLAGEGEATGSVTIAQVIPRASITSDTITFGGWVKANSTNSDEQAVLLISNLNESLSEVSERALQDDQWHFLQVTASVIGITDDIRISPLVSTTANSVDVAYFDGLMVIDGPVVPRTYIPHQSQDSITTSGTATITAGQTYVDVSHGLANHVTGIAPDRVFLQATTSHGNKDLYVSSKGDTAFRVTLNGTHTSDVVFDWKAETLSE